MILPAGALVMHEEAWNAYPYCRTVLTVCTCLTHHYVLRGVDDIEERVERACTFSFEVRLIGMN